MKTFQLWPDWVLGSTDLLEPYHTASAIPVPALIQGKTFTASPVTVEASLTWTAGLHFAQLVVWLAALTNTCRLTGLLLLTAQTANRSRLLSMDRTENSV